jgi:hypothetical protein
VSLQRPDATQVPHLTAQGGLGGTADSFAQVGETERTVEMSAKDWHAQGTRDQSENGATGANAGRRSVAVGMHL